MLASPRMRTNEAAIPQRAAPVNRKPAAYAFSRPPKVCRIGTPVDIADVCFAAAERWTLSSRRQVMHSLE